MGYNLGFNKMLNKKPGTKLNEVKNLSPEW